MDENKSNIQQFPNKKPPKKRLSRALSAVIAVVLLAVIVCCALVVVTLDGDLSAGAIERAITYYRRDANEQGLSRSLTFQSGSDNVYRGFGSGLFIAASTDLKLFSRNGEEVFSDEVMMANPFASASDKIIAVADIGGTTLLARNGVSDKLEYVSEHEIIGVSAGNGGQIALLTLDSGYKTSALVFDKSMELAYKASWSSGYAVCAAVSDDGKTLAAGLLTQSGGEVKSAVYFYPLNSEAPSAVYDINGELIVDMGWISKDTLCCVCESSLVFLDSDGELLGSFDFSDAYLTDYSLRGSGYCVILLRSYQSGGTFSVCVVTPDGETAARYRLSDEALSVSASGRYYSILQTGRLSVYNADTEPLGEADGLSGYAKAVTRSDGSVFLIGQNFADVFVP